MYSLETGSYSEREVLKALRSHRTVSYRYELLDKNDRPIGDVTASGSISFDSNSAIKRVASLSIAEGKEVDYLSDRIKPYMRLKVAGKMLEFPMGVFLMSSPSRQADAISISKNVECYDKTQILSDDKFDTRHLIRAGENYINAVATIIASAGITNYRLEASPLILRTDIEFALGTSKLLAINQLLKAINYNELWADSYGCIRATQYQQPEGRKIDIYYVPGKESIVVPGGEELLDTFQAPNKIIRYLENAESECIKAMVINSDPASKLSTVSRGRTIVDIEAVDDIADQATLEAYTQRVAAEKKIYQQVIFSSAVMPHHEFLDCLYLRNKELDVSGKFIETAWSIDMSVGGTMTHTCRKAVSI